MSLSGAMDISSGLSKYDDRSGVDMDINDSIKALEGLSLAEKKSSSSSSSPFNGSRRRRSRRLKNKSSSASSSNKPTKKRRMGVSKKSKSVKAKDGVRKVGSTLKKRISGLELKLKSPAKRLSNMLSVVCKDPVYCIALGKYNEYLKDYFMDYKELGLVDNNYITTLGGPSANGFVLRLPFMRPGAGFTAYTAIKCSLMNKSDNLFYEYHIGKNFINPLCKRFPCFVETYGLYRFRSEKDWDIMADYSANGGIAGGAKKMPPLQYMLEQFDTMAWEKSCVDSKHICILIQYFNNVLSLKHYFAEYEFPRIKSDMFGLMYQIYFPLQILRRVYTHYDLHRDNVLLYKPFGDAKKYIEMNYHLASGRVVQFPTEYVCKIIDYGRNYFSDAGTKMNTKKIIEKYICPASECEPDCGEEAGYSILQGRTYNPYVDFYDIYPDIPNMSHDLRLIDSLRKMEMGAYNSYEKNVYNDKHNDYKVDDFKNFFDDYCRIIYKHEWGTPPIVKNTKQSADAVNLDVAKKPAVKNVADVREMLETHIDGFVENVTRVKYDGWLKAGVMHIYEDGRDYEFVAVD